MNRFNECKVTVGLADKFFKFLSGSSIPEIGVFQSNKKEWDQYELESYVYSLNRMTILEEDRFISQCYCELQRSLFDSLDDENKQKFLFGGYTSISKISPFKLGVVDGKAVEIWKENFDEIIQDLDKNSLFLFVPLLLMLLPGTSEGHDTEILDKIGKGFLEDPNRYGMLIQELISKTDSNQDVAVLIFGADIIVKGADYNYENIVISKEFDRFQKFLPYLNFGDIEAIFLDANVSNISKEQGKILFEYTIDSLYNDLSFFIDIDVLFKKDVPFPDDLNEQRKKEFFSIVLAKTDLDPRKFCSSENKIHKKFLDICENNQDFLTQCFIMKSAMGIETFQEILKNLPNLKNPVYETVELPGLIS